MQECTQGEIYGEGVDIHPDKTFVERVSRGFTSLGYKIASEGIDDIAPQTREKFLGLV